MLMSFAGGFLLELVLSEATLNGAKMSNLESVCVGLFSVIVTGLAGYLVAELAGRLWPLAALVIMCLSLIPLFIIHDLNLSRSLINFLFIAPPGAVLLGCVVAVLQSNQAVFSPRS